MSIKDYIRGSLLDTAEVVRCKDCAYYVVDALDNHTCQYTLGYTIKREPDDFCICGRGVRKKVLSRRCVMTNLYRKIGVNVYTFMQKAKVTPEALAEKMSCSLKDIWNVIEGKVMMPPAEIKRLASTLGVTTEELVNTEPEILAPNLEFTKEFSNPESLDKVLDLMDEYVEISEANEEEGEKS